MKLPYGLGKCESILIIVTTLCLLVIVAVSCELESSNDIGILQRERIEVSESKIKTHQETIKELQNEIHCLVDQNSKLKKLKQIVYVHTLVEIDSVNALPFSGKSDFWATEAARLDSIRTRYLSRNN
tara:strand:- start:4390 stop:4770 length:381 start_codon:yes stop_codon:yes gene_type:complete